MPNKPEGWRNKRPDDPKRHSDAARGIESGRKGYVKKPKYPQQTKSTPRYIPKSLTPWKRADDYSGEDFSNYYVVYSKHRDSTLVDQSNWDVLVKKFGENNAVITPSFGHWAVGHAEIMMIRKDAPDLLLMELDEIITNVKEHYPLIDESDYSEKQYEATIDNIKSEGNIPDKKAREVFGWLHERNPDSVEDSDDQGGYPTYEAIQEAIEGLKKQ
jgi:hypothetical protein